MKNYAKWIGLCLLFLLSSLRSEAQTITSVNTSLRHGELLTLTGNQFGNRSTPTPWLYEDFEDQSTVIDLESNPGLHPPIIATQERAHGGFSALKCQLGDPEIETEDSAERKGHAIYRFPETLEAGNKLFISFWERFDWGVWYCDDGGQADVSYQIKNWRLSSGSQPTTPPYITQNNQSDCVAYGTDDFWPRNYFTRHNSIDADTYWYARDFEPEFAQLNDTWMLFELQVQQSDAGVANGSIELWLSRQGERRKVTEDFNILTHGGNTEEPDPGFNKLVIGDWIDRGGRSTTLYFDDVYVDRSWARVILADSNDFETASRREIQPTESWSENTIQIRVNAGRFESGDNLFLFVVDENGSSGPAYPVTLSLANDNLPSDQAGGGVGSEFDDQDIVLDEDAQNISNDEDVDSAGVFSNEEPGAQVSGGCQSSSSRFSILWSLCLFWMSARFLNKRQTLQKDAR